MVPMGYGAGWFARKPAKNLYEITEENQQNKQSEIPQEDLKESLEEIKENIHGRKPASKPD